MSIKIKRQFVTLEGRWGTRQVHYRRAGDGPLLLMLHQSPQSSRELVPLMEQWGEHFTIVAPDSPGYGQSDPLGADKAELSEFADATIEFMDAIGAGRFGVYGFHTGGMIGVALAHGYPDRVTAFACNGIVVPTDQELEEILSVYMPRFEPRWDGGHLVWLWARNRQQTIFFPWYKDTLASRMDFPMPTPEHQQNGVREFLRAADHYHVAYRAAFAFHAERIVPEISVPGLITASDMDPVQPDLARLKDVPDCVQVVASDTPGLASERCFAQVRSYPGETLPSAPATRPVQGRLWNQVVETDTGVALVKRGGQESGTPVVVLHGAGGSSASVAFIGESLAKSRSVIMIDLPGHGESDVDSGSGGVSIEACVEWVIDVLNQLDLKSADFAGIDGGAYVAVETAVHYPDRVDRLALVHPPELAPEEAEAWRESSMPSMEPEWSGGHLLRCWHMVRDGRLYFPWFRRDQVAIRWQEPELDDRQIQLEVTEYLKAEGVWQDLLRNQLEYPLSDRLTTCRAKAAFFASPLSPWYAATGNIAAQTGLQFYDLGDDTGQWGARLAAILSSPVPD